MMATAGFFCEPHNNHIAHTPLSAAFVSDPGLFDAALFLSNTVAPAALHMPQATKQFPNSERPEESAYNMTISPEYRERQTQLEAQWPTYLHYGTKDEASSIKDVLTRVDWKALGNATVVDVSVIQSGANTKPSDLAILISYSHLTGRSRKRRSRRESRQTAPLPSIRRGTI